MFVFPLHHRVDPAGPVDSLILSSHLFPMVPLDFSFYNYLNLYKYIIICVAAHFFLFQRNDISELNIVESNLFRPDVNSAVAYRFEYRVIEFEENNIL